MLFTTDVPAQKPKVCSVQWHIAGILPAAKEQKQSLGFAGPIAGIHQDVLMVAGGANFPDSMPWLGGNKKNYDDVFVFTLRKKASVAFYKSCKLPFPIAYSASCSTPEGIISVGGENGSGIGNKALLLQWNKTAENIRIINLPDLPFFITNAAITAIDDKVYVAGGEMKDDVSKNFLVLDLKDTKTGWQQLPSLPKPISHAVMVAQSNGKLQCIYVLGGRKSNRGSTSDLYASLFQFDLKTNKWSERKDLPYALSAGTGIAAGANSILLFGGDKGETFHKTEELIAAINKETDTARKGILNQQKIKLQSSHPGFSKQVLLYNTVKDEWTVIGSIPFDVPVTTTAVKWRDKVMIPGGEIKAGVRTPQILAGEIYFCEANRSKK